MIRVLAQVSAYVQYCGSDNKMTTDSFLQVLMIYPAWTPWMSETLSSWAPVQVSACVQHHGLDGVHCYQGGDQLFAGACGMLHIHSADTRNTEQRKLGSSAGKSLWQNTINRT